MFYICVSNFFLWFLIQKYFKYGGWNYFIFDNLFFVFKFGIGSYVIIIQNYDILIYLYVLLYIVYKFIKGIM